MIVSLGISRINLLVIPDQQKSSVQSTSTYANPESTWNMFNYKIEFPCFLVIAFFGRLSVSFSNLKPKKLPCKDNYGHSPTKSYNLVEH